MAGLNSVATAVPGDYGEGPTLVCTCMLITWYWPHTPLVEQRARAAPQLAFIVSFLFDWFHASMTLCFEASTAVRPTCFNLHLTLITCRCRLPFSIYSVGDTLHLLSFQNIRILLQILRAMLDAINHKWKHTPSIARFKVKWSIKREIKTSRRPRVEKMIAMILALHTVSAQPINLVATHTPTHTRARALARTHVQSKLSPISQKQLTTAHYIAMDARNLF